MAYASYLQAAFTPGNKTLFLKPIELQSICVDKAITNHVMYPEAKHQNRVG